MESPKKTRRPAAKTASVSVKPKNLRSAKVTLAPEPEVANTEPDHPALIKAVAKAGTRGVAKADVMVTTQPVVPIVGLGASAGGLEALEQFLKSVPAGSGLAFVVVQHLDPTHKGILVELLQRSTTMPVLQITDRMRVLPNHVYVIPPNRDLSMLHGILHLLEPAAPRGLRLPIDFFLRSLALDCRERSVGVILSGMGTDGSLGLRAIKENGGAVFVQTPDSAKFDGMPRSAIDAGLADVVASPQELPARIIGYIKRPVIAADPDHLLAAKDQSALEKIVILLRAQVGHDFSNYKKSSLYRRIERRMGVHQLPKIADYVRYLRENPQEATLLYKELLIGVTSFFRDPAVWLQLKDAVLPELLAARPEGGALRAWVAGCSTGEEAYSLAMVFRESLDVAPTGPRLSPKRTLLIFATDLDKDAIEKARTGTYASNIAADVGEQRLRRFFTEDKGGYRVNKEIREMVIFAPHNLISDPPFTKLDLLSCRNVLIYLDADLQRKLITQFHYSLNPSGVLLLGSAETAGPDNGLFVPFSRKMRIYRKTVATRAKGLEDFSPDKPRLRANKVIEPENSVSPSLAIGPPPKSLQAQAEQLLLRKYAPAAVLTNSQGDILFVSGKTGKYLEPAVGQANFNVLAMARNGLRQMLSDAFHRAVRQRRVIAVHDLQLETDGGRQTIDVAVEPLGAPEALSGMVLVAFAELPKPVPASPGTTARASSTVRADGRAIRRAELERRLSDAYAALEASQAENQSSQEELKSINEEMQSTNEELQSTNEELTTSKEELQSMNEELQTVNNELQVKVEELSRVSDDMSNLLNSTEIATLFLDEGLNVRRFTAQTTRIIKLIPSDVGRPVTDLVTDMDYPSLAADATEVLRSLAFSEKQVSATQGRWFQVRIMPYRTQQNRIQGVVITFTDISDAKRLEAQLRLAQARLEQRLASTDSGDKR